MTAILVLTLTAHAVAHLVGFVSGWNLAPLADLPYKTTVFGDALDIGPIGTRVVGTLWLAAAVAFAAAAAGVWTRAAWALRLSALAIALSLALCAAGWPDTRRGVAMNLALTLAVGIARSHPELVA